VACPCCGRRFSEFAPYKQDPNVECASCGSHERHRLLCFYFLREGADLLSRELSLLHFAPERCLQETLRSLPNLRYVSADLRSPRAADRFDITDIPYPDDSFDVLLCSHVLEHVSDDRSAMRELVRVLKPGGSALILIPIDETSADTDEGRTVTSPEERDRLFGEPDHVRSYGRDFTARLEQAGFSITVDRYVNGVDRATVERYAMRSSGMFVCTKPSRLGAAERR
jgi:SAM-dependent methyltransferase